MNGQQPQYLSPRVLQVSGLLLLAASAGFWMWTGRESLLLMSCAMTLITGGAVRGVFNALTKQSGNGS